MTTLAVASIAVASAACWWPVARALARRIERGGADPEVRARLAAVEARLDALGGAPAERALAAPAPSSVPSVSPADDVACRAS